MSFLYPRIVSVRRPNPTVGVGAIGYQGVLPSNESVIFTNIPASIQMRGATGQKAGLPADGKSVPVWKVLIPLMYCPLGSINERDIIVDDLGNRYQVSGSYWNSLGYQAECELLET